MYSLSSRVNLKKVYGYIRVSDPKQGEGVSLLAQKEAITRYAEKNNLTIERWFEEIETAAKQGRPVFLEMLTLAKNKKIDGIIIHKIDRSARNLEDWLQLVKLNDNLGIEIHFAHESIDMNARSGRLSADIQAVIAADYIRNLRQETIKGIYGRLNQGLYPFQAPIGYLDMGKGKRKEIDKKKAPLVKHILQMYSTGNYTQVDMIDEANKIGLTNHSGKKLTKTSIATLLSNPFYAGLMKVKGKIFKGIHEPIVSMRLYERIQDVRLGKTHKKIIKNEFLFRKIFKCGYCKYSLIGERQKGKIYYRCHTKGCPTKGFREDCIENKIIELFEAMELNQAEKKKFLKIIQSETVREESKIKDIQNVINLQKGEAEKKLEALVDALIDGVIDKEIYENRKFRILSQIQETENKLTELEQKKSILNENKENFLELTKSLKSIYISGNELEKRELLDLVTSNLLVEGKKLLISMKSPFQQLARQCIVASGLPVPTEHRTFVEKNIAKRTKKVEYIIIDIDITITKRPTMKTNACRQLALKIFEESLCNTNFTTFFGKRKSNEKPLLFKNTPNQE